MLLATLSAMPLCAWTTSLTAQELQTLVPGLSAAEAAKFFEKGRLTHFFDTNTEPRLVPNCSLTKSIEQTFSSVTHTLGVETLYIMNPGDGTHDARMLRWYNALRAISTMKGIKFYSPAEGRMRVLFRDSYVINNPDQQKRLPDPLVRSIPAESNLTIKQNDSTLGDQLFHLRYQGAEDAISMSMVNLNTQFLLFIPIIGPHHMVLQLVLVPYKDTLIFYAGVEVKTISLFGLQHASRESILNRVEALHNWFRSHANVD